MSSPDNMQNATFAEVKLFQVKPDRLAEFESLMVEMADAQRARPGCVNLHYMKRFYTIDGLGLGDPPRELTKIVKCVKYYSYWEFTSKETCGKAIGWFFEQYLKRIEKLLIVPFDINLGDSMA